MSKLRRNGTSILVIDDVAEMREMLMRLLRVMGFSPLYGAKSGEDAGEFLYNQRIDLVLCDWNMPGMSGLDMLRRVRESEKNGGVPFIMVTGENHRENIESAIIAGVTDYLLKPFNATTLENKVIAALSARR